MSQLIRKLFLQHPREQGMTYAYYATHSLAFSAKFAKASLQCPREMYSKSSVPIVSQSYAMSAVALRCDRELSL